MKKKYMCMGILLIGALISLAAQQITRFAIVDTSRVYSTFFRDSVAVRNYEAKKTEYQVEIDRLTTELKTLHSQKLTYEKEGKAVEALHLEASISKKTDFLTEYTKVKNTELETLKARLNSDDPFYSSLYDTIKRVAESEGYSMVFTLQPGNGILWYSPTVDITDKIIANLKPLN